MKHNLILVVVLLATLSIINAIPHQLNKRATSFTTCPSGLSPNTFNATLQPDPPTAGDCAITATGTFVIPEGSKLLVQFFDSTANAVGEPLTADICTNGVDTCPTDGTDGTDGPTPFNIMDTVTIPADAPPPFALAISIVDTTGNILGCTFGTTG
ncbi:unnamed protein product [Rhizophagus irregularis]|uniref:Phosphatidylglycerol/phosphatidylinositol transfer protein n=1 Tax=Rhizophagus irregularis TaxID=588596 RepID=A0A2I1H641_9GLOM|nr:hypothetical protein RhiirA4_501219 [Rhizophagus irregularis]CAB4438366.1 unnamed protein product [Rhizophagus irregularis]